MCYDVQNKAKYLDFDVNKYYTISDPFIGTGMHAKTRGTYV